MSQLPTLPSSGRPVRLAQSCASISLPLLTLLDSVLPKPPFLTLSIGSGPGLLEALFLHHYPSWSETLFGVEVPPTENNKPVNRFLKEQNMVIVGGTWAVVDEEMLEEKIGKETEVEEKKLCEKTEVKGLVFSYPRQTGLVKKYLDEMGGRLEVVVWVGPRCDEEGFGRVFGEWGFGEEVKGEEVVEEGEVVVVWRRKKA
ncbi:hypothetical protein QBC43DRAFT_271591 [Cladorrhinum sp. PSN259]|nr:hypothetical protein QBC43DRAFT_271591 [Cladorrhinum sp. PSN259]